MSKRAAVDFAAAVVAPDPVVGSKRQLSSVAGAGAGTGLILWLQNAGLDPTVTTLLEALAPWVTIGIAFLGPMLTSFLTTEARYWGLAYLRRRAKRICKTLKEGSPERIRADKSLEELDGAIADIIGDVAIDAQRWFRRDRTSTE